MKKKLFLIFLLIFSPIHLFAEDSGDISDQRAKDVEKWSSSGFGDVTKILKNSINVLKDENASFDELDDAANRANAAANFVGFITDEYEDYRRDVSRYDFVLVKLDPPYERYSDKANSLKDVRNRIFLRMGDILKEQGKLTEAFFYYRDAFRLSIFSDYWNKSKGTRWKAEQRMKELLEIQYISSYI